MDIEQLIFPFVMAVLTNSLMIVIIYFLRKIPAFANLFSVWFMVILYLFCILRIFLPIEFPGIQIVLEDQSIYTWINEFLYIYDDASHSGSHPNIIAWYIVGLCLVGIVVLGMRSLMIHRSFKKYLFANGNYATDAELALFSETAKEILKSDNNVSLRKTDVISGAVVFGLIRKTVLIPDEDYTEDELRMMFRHECMHVRNKDLWIKLLVQIYCCIFWWNPFAYLLKKDLDLTLEMKCDLNTIEGFSNEQKLMYIETLKNHSVSQKQKRTPFVVSAELVDGKKKDKLMERIKKLLAVPSSKTKRIAANAIAASLLLLIFTSSFVFIWQPRYETQNLNEAYYELAEGGEIIDGSMAYLMQNPDGNYTFYLDDEPQMVVPKEEVEKGMYEGYPIYEK